MKKRYILLISIVLIIIIGFSWFTYSVVYSSPDAPETQITANNLEVLGDDHYRLGNSWLKKNKDGNWESYIEGSPYDRGITIGILHQQLLRDQEVVFVNEIEKNVPSAFFRRFLTFGIAWFNRNLDQYIPLEYRLEIYGISQSFSDDYDYIGPKYNRIINYHAAHDIGHAVQNMHLVGCTSLGVWNFSDTSQMMMSGRNFDFYFGDDFAKEKIILLMNPEKGYKFLSVTWGGFMGVVSGMNEKGLSITLNSAISEIPTDSGTPVSIIARDILQYAATIDESIEIANRYNSFVSEMFTISSLVDKTMVVIEKSPTQTGVYFPETDTLIVANHYQSGDMKFLPINLDHMETSESVERYSRTEELTMELNKIDQNSISTVLRDQSGIYGEDIGVGNPKCINQLLAHHAVIFDNVNQITWVSNYPYQENVFNAYNLNDFDKWASDFTFPISIDSLEIAADPFYLSEGYQTFELFKSMKAQVIQATNNHDELEDTFIDDFIETNPSFYEAYRLVGNYYFELKNNDRARIYYEEALMKNIAYEADRDFIKGQIELVNQ
ncbi:MAG: C45 family autoproteolytic acyltransferase/hydrolase [Reichenbachiella sp.]